MFSINKVAFVAVGALAAVAAAQERNTTDIGSFPECAVSLELTMIAPVSQLGGASLLDAYPLTFLKYIYIAMVYRRHAEAGEGL